MPAAYVAAAAGPVLGWFAGRWPVVRRAAAAGRVARTDALTGVANRVGLSVAADAVFGPERSGRAGVLLVDLDGFKPVNDRYGHATGDEVLSAAADRLTAAVAGRPGTTVARLGGDEFVVLLAAADDVLAVGELVAAGLAAPYVVGGVELAVGASVGAATVPCAAPVPAAGLAAALAAADVAMYAAKRGGGGLRFAPDLDQEPAPIPLPRRPAGRLRDAAVVPCPGRIGGAA
jgi:diguanylate cyclase (GGDEF)-like protein